MPVSVIVPAYNEEATIAQVLKVLKEVAEIDEIITVSDGSKDATAEIARSLGVKVIELPHNMGKGAAVMKGLEYCRGEYVLLIDADLVGLSSEHVKELLVPVLDGQADMTVGVFRKGRFSTDLAQMAFPWLSGQRALKRSILEGISNLEEAGYGIETALTRYAQKEHIKVKYIELKDITHIMKEEKLGFLRGIEQRLKMYWQIYKGLRLVKR